MHGTLPGLGVAEAPAPPRCRGPRILPWLLRGLLVAFGLAAGAIGGLIIAFGTGLLALC